jgi:aspartate-semialdehyde dehydrogenase
VIARKAKIPVAVLGATGAVGQTFVRLLEGHPYFEVAEVGASSRSVGRPYGAATSWREGTLSDRVAALEVRACDPGSIRSRIVFSALDASVAREVESDFAGAGSVVLSNAKSYRMDVDVPLVIPEVNAEHLALVRLQREHRGWKGAIVTNANCAATVAAVALAPLHEAFGVRRVIATTLQAVSGAGYPGVASLDILGNVIPYIGGEEEKIETELCKILGTMDRDGTTPAEIAVSAHANRVPVEHGHTVCLSIGLDEPVGAAEALAAIRSWKGSEVCAGLPSAPSPPIVVRDEPDRPQVRRDVGTGGGMAVVVGRVRPDPVLDLRMVAMAHNTVRGAAGGSILNAEALGRMGLLRGVADGSW